MLYKGKKRGNIVKLKKLDVRQKRKKIEDREEYLNIGTVNLSLDETVCKDAEYT